MTALPAHARAPEDQASRLRAIVDAMRPGAAARPRAIADAAPARSCPLIAVASGKGGVGKTSTCVNLAIALAQRSLRATLLDADLGLANADVMCGITPTTRLDSAIEPRPVNSGATRLGPVQGSAPPRRSLSRIAIQAPGGFRLVPGAVGLMRMANLTQPEREALVQGLADLEQDSDVVVIDTAAGIAAGVTAFVEAADIALVVVTPEPTSIADAYALIKCVWPALRARPGGGSVALAINNAASHEEGRAVFARVCATCKRFLGFEPTLAGVIRHDPEVMDAVRARRPVRLNSPKCRASKDLNDLAGEIIRLAPIRVPSPPPRRGLLARLWAR